MEEELEEMFKNETLEEDFFSHSMHYKLEMTMIALSCLVGITCDVIMITAIAINKRMRNRTNLILLCCFTCDVFNLLATPPIFVEWLYDQTNAPLRCVTLDTDMIFQLFETICMMVLLSDTLMETKKITDRIMIITFIGCLTAILLLIVGSCILGLRMSILYLSFALTMLVLLLATVITDIYRCFKGKTNSISDDSRFRSNIVRIYCYTIVCGALLIFITEPVHMGNYIFGLICMMSSAVLMYVYNSDQKFRICILNLFRRKENRYNVNATIGFNEDDDRKVILDINAGTD